MRFFGMLCWICADILGLDETRALGVNVYSDARPCAMCCPQEPMERNTVTRIKAAAAAGKVITSEGEREGQTDIWGG